MKSAATGTLSGCVVWVIVFFILLTCLIPTAALVGGLSSTLAADFVAGTLEPYLCPEGSHAEIITFQTTSIDDFGNAQPATGFEMQCVNSQGEITRDPSPDYGFIWLGVLGLASLVLSALLAFLLAAPAGVLIARLFKGRKDVKAG
jgi:hypothetical protein